MNRQRTLPTFVVPADVTANPWCRWCVWLALSWLPSLAFATESAGATDDTRPVVADRYQAGIDRAWARADEGHSPTSTCASVIGTASGMASNHAPEDHVRAEAIAAADACYVGAMVRYLSHRLDAIEAGDANCIAPITAMAIHRGSLGTMIDDIGASRVEFDARISAAVGDRVRAACPDSAAVILGEQ